MTMIRPFFTEIEQIEFFMFFNISCQDFLCFCNWLFWKFESFSDRWLRI